MALAKTEEMRVALKNAIDVLQVKDKEESDENVEVEKTTKEDGEGTSPEIGIKRKRSTERID
jgi:hypothetical protein